MLFNVLQSVQCIRIVGKPVNTVVSYFKASMSLKLAKLNRSAGIVMSLQFLMTEFLRKIIL